MNTGWKVSLGGHGALILAALVGWPFASDTESAAPQTVSVTLVTMDELPVEGAPTPPKAATPAAPEPAPEAIAALAPPEAPRPPEPPARPKPDPAPEAKAPPAPPQPTTPAAPPPPVDRVAPVPQPAPPKPLPEAETQQEAVKKTPAPAPEAPRAEEQEAAAPREAAPEIVTEATKTAPRPDRRPPRPQPQVAEPEPEAEPETDVAEETTPEAREPEPQPQNVEEPPAPKKEPAAKKPVKQAAVNSALAEALAGDPGPAEAEPQAAPQSSGPPLTQGERDGLRVAVSRCWNIAALSTESAAVTVVVGMEMTLDGVPSNLRMISYRGGSEAAAQQAYETARRAVLRCQPYSLPSEKYDQWRTIEMTFNPDEMRRR